MDDAQVLAFRLARSGLAAREAKDLAEAAACPASDFHRDAALLALAARVEDVSRESYDEAVEGGDLVVAHTLRVAIHAIAPADFPLWGRALTARDDAELVPLLGDHVHKLAAERGFALTDAVDETTAATKDALRGGRRLDKNALHEELRKRVRDDLLPWCRGCGSHHVPPRLWRYAVVKAGVRLDAERRYVKGKAGRVPPGSEAVRRFLRFYGPATPDDLAVWAGIGKPHARRLWDGVADLAEVDGAWMLAEDQRALASRPGAEGIRLLPPGDPYLQKPNRPLLAPDPELRKRLFRPVASPGVVLADGRLAGAWRAKAMGKKLELTVEKLGRVARKDVAEEAQRVAALRGAAEAVVVLA